jgi:hypothetical protein
MNLTKLLKSGLAALAILAAPLNPASAQALFGRNSFALPPLTGSCGTITSSAPCIDLTQTWNNAGVAFVGANLNMVSTASNGGSDTLRMQYGGVTKYRFEADGDSAQLGRGLPLGAPTGTPTAATNGAGVLTGTYKYAYTELPGVGQTTVSPSVTIVAAGNTIRVVVPEPRRGVSGRRLYRTVAGGNTFFLVHDFGGGGGYFQTTWDDNTPDGSLGAQAPTTDTSVLYGMELNAGVKYFRTHPDQGTNPADITVMTGDSGNTPGAYAIDSYGQFYVRTYQGPSYTSDKTGNLSSHFLATLRGVVDNGASPSTVWEVRNNGNTLITLANPLSDAAVGDGNIYAFSATGTMPSVTTAAVAGGQVNMVGAGSSAFAQTAFNGVLQAGYTGSAATYGAQFVNQTVGSGKTFGFNGWASGATTATAIGVQGLAGNGTKNIGVFGSSAGVDLASASLTFPGSVTGIAGAFSNGNNTDDIITGFDNTTAVFRVKDTGTLVSTHTGGAFAWNFNNTTGGAAGVVSLQSGTSMTVGTTNNVPMLLVANNVTGLTINSDGTAKLTAFTVSGLPTCGSSQKGELAYVTDATAPTYRGALTGGGAVATPVFCNGSAWESH